MSHKFHEIIQSELRVKPWLSKATARLPGIQPLDLADWIWVDDAFSAQMAYRDYLLSDYKKQVLAQCHQGDAAALELLDMVLNHLQSVKGYDVRTTHARRPDGVNIQIHKDAPMETLGRLLQQDFCLLTKDQDEHVLQAAVLCFPASWSLDQKIGKPMIAIHSPVPEYDETQAQRVQNMFDRMRPDQALWRANCLIYSNPDLFQPRRTDNKRMLDGDKRWVRVERQTLRKLPETGAIAFGIHTFIVPLDSLPKEEWPRLPEFGQSYSVKRE